MINKETYLLNYYEQLPHEIGKLKNVVRGLSNDENKDQIKDLIKQLKYFENIIAENEWTNLQLHTKLMEIIKYLLIMKEWAIEDKLEKQGVINMVEFINEKVKG